MTHISEKSLEDLFVSKVRIKALTYFMLNPDRPIHLRGAVRELKEEINAVRRELMRLAKSKILTSEKEGNRKYFKLNLDHPLIPELMSMFHKTYGLGGQIVEEQSKLGEIEFAFLTPAYTKGFYHGNQVIDLLIIGVVDLKVLESIVDSIQDREGREVHYSILKPSEFIVRKRRKDQFLLDLFIQDLVMLVGRKEDLIRS